MLVCYDYWFVFIVSYCTPPRVTSGQMGGIKVNKQISPVTSRERQKGAKKKDKKTNCPPLHSKLFGLHA